MPIWEQAIWRRFYSLGSPTCLCNSQGHTTLSLSVVSFISNTHEKMTIPELFIIESLPSGDFRDGEMISTILRNNRNRSTDYRSVRNMKELEEAIDAFTISKMRWLHFSCHGNKNEIGLADESVLTFLQLGKLFKGRLNDRRLFLSACNVGRRRLAEAIFANNPQCHSVIASAHKPGFDESAIYWAAFYYAMARKEEQLVLPKGKLPPMKRRKIKETLEALDNLLGSTIRFYARPNNTGIVERLR